MQVPHGHQCHLGSRRLSTLRTGQVATLSNNLGEDEWKIDKLAKDHYPSFKQTWFTNKTEEKERELRNERFNQKEDTESSVSPVAELSEPVKTPQTESASSDAHVVPAGEPNSDMIDWSSAYEMGNRLYNY
ncbi:hypothetical protein JVT61DRAFT_10764 [Boletus reticuloceps]|uniref:Uncharacterized protein n=1 Tax=Boletus reticuloceps TaxID=495285 RepID=A0A8I2YFL8_9AGAM|nr:hypothetical protein JVT61DRAFT_10764 [Boletus reticuloceps]